MSKRAILLAGLLIFAFANQVLKAQDGLTGNYVVVVGAFSSRSNAEHFENQAKVHKMNPVIELNKFRNLYYVCVLETKDHEAAIKEATRLRTETQFKDSWVYNGTMQDLTNSGDSKDIHPITKAEITPVVAVVVAPVETHVVDSSNVHHEAIRTEVKNKPTVMKKGEVDRLDFIYFYKDAAVLRPESQYEVNHLAQLLKENPTVKIRIHGHTNGNEPGKIIKHVGENTDFFSLDNTVEDYGTAKELSELRASVIKEYLVKNGIDAKRMSVKGWGGKKPLFPVDDDKAVANVRVEIEVVKAQ